MNNFLNKNDVIAVIGVSENKEKYGNIVFFDLLKKGYDVYPIHQDGGFLNDIKRYKDLSYLPKKPTIVNIVVKPEISKEILEQCLELNIKKVWLQPGSENDEIINFCKKNNLECLHNSCIMIETN